MRQRLRAQVIDQLRGRLDQRLHVWVFAVEHAQRVAVQAPARVVVELRLVLLEVGDQRLAVCQALGRLA